MKNKHSFLIQPEKIPRDEDAVSMEDPKCSESTKVTPQTAGSVERERVGVFLVDWLVLFILFYF